ncbi:Mediator of RNA polymerase II transcription subunit 22 [Dissostichus eleginoides]|uniref:Mediator of RNA polymerase II transcription subunit 22 n=1 Tax=Dissostichus eleginoides TaxID=100907 RepID=A0AAD9F1D4_DISEL|nr:Mediator of RNA polymerase II transcription subunit 22 [Dissostichus eleginoides]
MMKRRRKQLYLYPGVRGGQQQCQEGSRRQKHLHLHLLPPAQQLMKEAEEERREAVKPSTNQPEAPEHL